MITLHNPLILDGHNDTLLRLYRPETGQERSFLVRSEEGHIDLPRAIEGGLGGGFFAIFTPKEQEKDDSTDDDKKEDQDTPPLHPPAIDHAYAQQFTIAVTAHLFRLEAEAGGKIKVVRTVDELETCLREGILAIILHIEGAEAIDPELDTLYVLYEAGLRSIGIVWSRSNAFGHGVPFTFPSSPDTGPGLTEAGRKLVQTCNRLGILLDLSHLNEKGFWEVADLSQAPLVATHSGAHALCASPRNLTDEQLDAIAETGGIVGLNFHVGFLRADGKHDAETSLTEIVRHVDYMVDRIGIDYVGFGSDFDGARMPGDLVDVAGLPKLMAALREQGYDEAALGKLAHENWIRVLRETWK